MKDVMLFEVTRVVDDDTGIWEMNEIEYGVPTETSAWLDARTGRRAELAKYVRWLADRIEAGEAPFRRTEPRDAGEGAGGG